MKEAAASLKDSLAGTSALGAGTSADSNTQVVFSPENSSNEKLVFGSIFYDISE